MLGCTDRRSVVCRSVTVGSGPCPLEKPIKYLNSLQRLKISDHCATAKFQSGIPAVLGWSLSETILLLFFNVCDVTKYRTYYRICYIIAIYYILSIIICCYYISEERNQKSCSCPATLKTLDGHPLGVIVTKVAAKATLQQRTRKTEANIVRRR